MGVPLVRSARLARRSIHHIQLLLMHPGRTIRRVRSAGSLLRGGGLPSAIRELEADTIDHRHRDAYQRWIAEFEADRRPEVTGPAPLVSVILAVADGDADMVATIQSLLAQTYAHWELHLVVTDAIEIAPDPRVTVHTAPVGSSCAAVANLALSAATGAWVTRVMPGDVVAPSALATMVLAARVNPSAELIYGDQDVLDESGGRHDPWFKPDYSRELLRSLNYFGPSALYSLELIRRLGGWRDDLAGSEPFDLNLRAIETIDAGQVVHVPHVLHHARSSAGDAMIGPERTAVRVLRDHLRRSGSDADVVPVDGAGLRIKHVLPTPAPAVTIVIPTKDNGAILRACIDSITSLTTYPSFDVLVVDNGSSSPSAVRLLEDLDGDYRVRVIRRPGPFNFSALNNDAVQQATGEVLALVNDDIEVVTPGWLEEMVGLATHDGIGCVGAKLLYPNGRIQHAGVVVGIRDYAGHAHKYLPRDHPGDNGRLRVAHEVSAVTGACLVVRKDVYLGVGGMDTDLAVSGNDIDFCLRVREAGYSNVWTPFAELLHLESATRGRDLTPAKFLRRRREAARLRGRWNLANDPFYSPNLTRDRDDFSPRSKRDIFG